MKPLYVNLFEITNSIPIDPWITNWFMAAGGQGQSYVMEKITQKFLAYWNDQNQDHDYYFQFHK